MIWGIYSVDSQHFDFCPMSFEEIYYGSSGAAVRVGVSVICYILKDYWPQYGECEYVPIPSCTVKCKDASAFYPCLVNKSA